MTWVLVLIIWIEPSSPLEIFVGYESKEACLATAKDPDLFLKDWGFRADVEIDAECHPYNNVQLLNLDNSILL